MKLKIALSGLLLAFVITTNVKASSDTDILLDLLVKKGVLTAEDAASTKAELTAKKEEEQKKQAEQEKKKAPFVNAKSSFDIGGSLQLRYQRAESGTNSFDDRRIRLDLSGHPDDKWEWKILGEYGGSASNVISSVSLSTTGTLSTTTTKSQKPVLLDAYIRYKFNDYVRLQAGQFKVPFSQENLQGDNDLDFIDRSQVVEKLVPSRDIGSNGRDIGVQVDGTYTEGTERKWVDYAVALFNGAGINTSDDNKDKDFAGRAVVYPIKDLSLGISGYKGLYGSSPVTRDRIGGELAYIHDPFFLKAEYVTGTDNTTDKDGWYVAGGYKFLKKFQAVARYDVYDPNINKSGDQTDVTTIGLNWFLNKNNKLQVNYEYKTAQTGNPDDVLAAQYQFKF